jgi:hypothetical protein
VVKFARTEGEWVSLDTPAVVLSRAFASYSNRLALGMPVPASTTLPLACPHVLKGGMQAAHAAGLAPTVHDGYSWLTYNQMSLLTTRVVKALLQQHGASAPCCVHPVAYLRCSISLSLCLVPRRLGRREGFCAIYGQDNPLSCRWYCCCFRLLLLL